jgi:hypothetical protein
MSTLLHLVRAAAPLCLAVACAWTPEPEGNALDAGVGPGRADYDTGPPPGGEAASSQGGMDSAGFDAGVDTAPDADPAPPETSDASAAACGDADASVDAAGQADASVDAAAVGSLDASADATPPASDAHFAGDATADAAPDAGCAPR